MRIAFFGSGSPLSVAALHRIAQGHDVRVVVEPRRVLGRRDRLKRLAGMLPPTPLAEMARELGVPRIDYRADHAAQAVRSSGADLIVIASFPAILPAELLEIPGINLHQSLLPRHRGADPLFWTYHADDRESGTTVHWLDGGVDRGDIISQQVVPLTRGYPIRRLYDDLTGSGSEQLVDALDAIEAGAAGRTPQGSASATNEPSPSKRTWRVEFDVWPAERTWHFLSGTGSAYGSLCRDPFGADLPAGKSATYTLAAHGRPPGTWQRAGDGSLFLYCHDGTVTSLP